MVPHPVEGARNNYGSKRMKTGCVRLNEIHLKTREKQCEELLWWENSYPRALFNYAQYFSYVITISPEKWC